MDNELQELLKQANELTQPIEPESKKSSVLKNLFKEYVYDSGETEPVSQESVESSPNTHITPAVLEKATEGVTKLEEVYEAASISSKFSVYELEEMLNSEELRTQPIAQKQMAIKFALKHRGISVDDAINDAILRDKALDKYATVLVDLTNAKEQAISDQIKAKEKEMEAYFLEMQSSIEELKSQASDAKTLYLEFLETKKKEEKRISDIISIFVDSANPISIGESA